jgi:hypothetical protein
VSDLTLDDILSADGGQDYILSIYPELEPCFRIPKHKVKLRDDDKTASAGVFKHRTSGLWMVHDFGGGADSKSKTAFNLCMDVNRCDSGEAFKILAKFYGKELKVTEAKADYSSRLPVAGELPKQIVNVVYKDLGYNEALTILSKKAWEGIEWNGTYPKDDVERLEMAKMLFEYYHFKVIHKYEMVNSEGTLVHIYTATDSFPMFEIVEELPSTAAAGSHPGEPQRFSKIYKPKDQKQYRFMWRGKKPEKFIHGLKQHINVLTTNEAANDKKLADAGDNASKLDAKKDFLPTKFPKIVLCSGGSDALNVAALGYRTIWMNSESAKLEEWQLKEINKRCHDFYNLPDIDHTGRTTAKELAWQYVDVKTIWLPTELAKRSDGKGGYCKDVRDYLKWNDKWAFKTLVKNALPFRFWDEMPKKDKDGYQMWKFGREWIIYEFNNVRGYNFLQMSGFWRYEEPKLKEGYQLIKLEGNIVKRVLANDVKNYIHIFLKDRQYAEDLRNQMYRSAQLTEGSFSNLDLIDPDFMNYTKDSQTLFFEDINWKVTAKGIEAIKRPDVYVWDHKILRPKSNRGVLDSFRPKILPTLFTIHNSSEKVGNKQTTGWEVEWADNYKECDFLKFMLQTCKIHWRKELEERMEWVDLPEKAQNEYLKEHELPEDVLEVMKQMSTEDNRAAYKRKYQFRLDGTLLTPEERAEQVLCYVNKVFAVGYMLHRYKDPTKPWAVFVMDYRVSEEGASNGRAGKGILSMGLKKMLDFVRIDGRDPQLFNNQFLFGGVERGNEMIHIEDWDEYLDFERLFNFITGSLYSNKKGMQAVDIENQDFGKFWIDTNYADRFMSGSAKGRKLHTVFADYYHEDLEFYREVRTPATELGRRMFDEWDESQWNLFYNFMCQCTSFFLGVADKGLKIDPPFGNIIRRNSLATMGENFRQWADTYFELRFNEAVARKDAFEDFMRSSNQQKISPQSFLKKLLAWVEFNNYRFNPEHVQGWTKAGDGKKYGYIKRSVPSIETPGKYTTIEYVYVEKTVASSEARVASNDQDKSLKPGDAQKNIPF